MFTALLTFWLVIWLLPLVVILPVFLVMFKYPNICPTLSNEPEVMYVVGASVLPLLNWFVAWMTLDSVLKVIRKC